jgi:hypothetical protein
VGLEETTEASGTVATGAVLDSVELLLLPCFATNANAAVAMTAIIIAIREVFFMFLLVSFY